MANNHRHRMLSMVDFTKPWKLKFFLHGDRKVPIGCEICHRGTRRPSETRRKDPISIRKVGRTSLDED